MSSLYISESIKELFRSEKFAHYISKTKVRKNEIVLHAGEVAEYLILIEQGCIRQYFIKDDASEITAQFFFENELVSSFESAFDGIPSRSFLEALEDSSIFYIKISIIKQILNDNETMKNFFIEYLMKRFKDYINMYSSFILDSPEIRYKNIIEKCPQLLRRVPQQYIATYLGITPVSLSRIKKRLSLKQ